MTKEQFEAALTEAAKSHLKPSIDADRYVDAVLNEKFDGESYGDCYHEIRGMDTKSGNPFVVS